MIQLHRILKNPLCVSIKILTNLFGVRAKIYRPIHSNTLYAFEDFNSNDYEDEPIFEGELLFTKLSGDIHQNINSYFATFDFEDNAIYPSCDLEPLPINSLITIEVQDVEQNSNFIISEVKEYVYNGNKIIKYYKVKPLVERVPQEEFIDQDYVDQELEEIATNREIEATNSNTHSTEILDEETINDRLKEKDTLLKKKRVNTFIEVNDD